jgi:hypothetical protein
MHITYLIFPFKELYKFSNSLPSFLKITDFPKLIRKGKYFFSSFSSFPENGFFAFLIYE